MRINVPVRGAGVAWLPGKPLPDLTVGPLFPLQKMGGRADRYSGKAVTDAALSGRPLRQERESDGAIGIQLLAKLTLKPAPLRTSSNGQSSALMLDSKLLHAFLSFTYHPHERAADPACRDVLLYMDRHTKEVAASIMLMGGACGFAYVAFSSVLMY